MVPALIPDSYVQDLLARVDIVDVVGKYVQLRKAGVNLLGLCPFHNEKSPSFTVSPSKQFYHCFGCGAHGTAIGFLIEHTGASFPEAVRNLSATVGMRVPEEPRSPRQMAADRERRAERSLHEQALESAQQFYLKSLRASPDAIAYLKKRGLTGQIAQRFGLGWSGEERQGLMRVFADYQAASLVETGLVIESEDGRRYDRFRERIMFPIRNGRGVLIGFGGRLIRPGEPKYLNSPETPLFSKGHELYGLWEARQGIRKEGQVIVVEGYMDVVGLAQHGLENAVATLGTATTEHHVQKLMRASERIVFSFDGDRAGRKAAWRALQACLPLLRDDVSIRFLFLPAEHDPDSYIRDLGLEAFRACLGEAVALSRFLLDELSSRHDLREAEGRSACVHEARPLFAMMPEGVLKMQLQRDLAERVKFTPEELAAVMGASTTVASPAGGRAAGMAGAVVSAPHESSAVHHPDGMGHWMPDDHLLSYEHDEGGQVWYPEFDAADQGGAFDSMQSAGMPSQVRQQQGQSTGWKAGGGKGAWQGKGDWKGKKGDWKGKGGKKGWRDDDQGPVRNEPKVVPSLAKRLLRLLMVHPGLVEGMGEQQLEMLAQIPRFDLVVELIALAKSSGAQHVGALKHAVAPGSDLEAMLRGMEAEALVQEELPNPQAEWDDALRRAEIDSIRVQQAALAQAGLPDEASRQQYKDLSMRLLLLTRL